MLCLGRFGGVSHYPIKSGWSRRDYTNNRPRWCLMAAQESDSSFAPSLDSDKTASAGSLFYSLSLSLSFFLSSFFHSILSADSASLKAQKRYRILPRWNFKKFRTTFEVGGTKSSYTWKRSHLPMTSYILLLFLRERVLQLDISLLLFLYSTISDIEVVLLAMVLFPSIKIMLIYYFFFTDFPNSVQNLFKIQIAIRASYSLGSPFLKQHPLIL